MPEVFIGAVVGEDPSDVVGDVLRLVDGRATTIVLVVAAVAILVVVLGPHQPRPEDQTRPHNRGTHHTITPAKGMARISLVIVCVCLGSC